jgi:hypothetical protein
MFAVDLKWKWHKTTDILLQKSAARRSFPKQKHGEKKFTTMLH